MNKILSNEERDNICSNLFQNKFNVTCWQPNPTDPNNKIKYVTKLNKILSDENRLEFKSRFNKTFDFSEGDVFFFCDKLKVIFKSKFLQVEGDIISVNKPEEITLLQEGPFLAIKEDNTQTYDTAMKAKVKMNFNDASDVMRVGRVNEDEKFAHMRAAPRSKVSKEQKVTVKFLSKKFQDKELDLFDLSRGGAGIVFKNSDYFAQGDFLEIVQIDGKDINPTLKGEVMSVRSHDVEKGLFKAGIKFV